MVMGCYGESLVRELVAVFGRDARIRNRFRLNPSMSVLTRRDVRSIRASSSSHARTVFGSFALPSAPAIGTTPPFTSRELRRA